MLGYHRETGLSREKSAKSERVVGGGEPEKTPYGRGVRQEGKSVGRRPIVKRMGVGGSCASPGIHAHAEEGRVCTDREIPSRNRYRDGIVPHGKQNAELVSASALTLPLGPGETTRATGRCASAQENTLIPRGVELGFLRLWRSCFGLVHRKRRKSEQVHHAPQEGERHYKCANLH